MAAANTITPLKDWRYGIPGHGKPLTEQEREELLRKGWSKKHSPLVNPVLGNQLRINPGNPREQLLAHHKPKDEQKLVNINSLSGIKGSRVRNSALIDRGTIKRVEWEKKWGAESEYHLDYNSVG